MQRVLIFAEIKIHDYLGPRNKHECSCVCAYEQVCVQKAAHVGNSDQEFFTFFFSRIAGKY